MDDLISRQAAIDAADRADYTGLAVEDVKKVTDEVVKEIKKLPSAQPEIIRCKECKNHNLCAIEDEARDEAFFCKWGERRD